MYSFTDDLKPCEPSPPPNTAWRLLRRRQRVGGTAVVETLLVTIPLWFFFLMIMFVLNYWESKHLNQTCQLESQVLEYTLSGVIMNTGRGKNALEDACKDNPDDFQFCIEEDDIDAGEAKLPFHNIYIMHYVSDKVFLKVMTTRGNSSWLAFPWLRGQYWGDGELKKRKDWFNKMGDETLEKKLRQPLMLGS